MRKRNTALKIIGLVFMLFAATGCDGLNFVAQDGTVGEAGEPSPTVRKAVYTRFALVSDVGGEGENLEKALQKAKDREVDHVVGLGDYTKTGTVEELKAIKSVFDESQLLYFVIPGDHDLWDSRDKGRATATENFMEVFGAVIEPSLQTSYDFGYKGVTHIMIDNSDFYLGLDQDTWNWLERALSQDANRFSTTDSRLPKYVMMHQSLAHPYLDHLMGRESESVDLQRQRLLDLISQHDVDEVFSGDIHQFNRFTDTDSGVKMTTVGALATERNPERPSFVIVTVFVDGSYDVAKVEI